MDLVVSLGDGLGGEHGVLAAFLRPVAGALAGNLAVDDDMGHVIPISNKEDEEDESVLIPFNSKIIYRVKTCITLLEKNNSNDEKTVCIFCKSCNKSTIYQENKKKLSIATPAKSKAPLTATSKPKVVLALKQERLKCAQLTSELEKMKIELRSNTHTVDNSLNNDFLAIISDQKMTPFMNLFWQQQKKLFQTSPKGMRYHPMIIR